LRSLLLLLPLALAACGDLPRPFEGDPGATALRLSRPPPSRLAVPSPGNALLPETGADALAGAITDALVGQELPAVAGPVHPGDWRLAMSAQMQGDTVVPTYTVMNPSGVVQGSVEGKPVSARLWADADPAALKQAAASAAPDIAGLLAAVEAARLQSDPTSLMNRPARIFVKDVTGAPGDGNTSLTRDIKAKLPGTGEMVQSSPQGADYTVIGTVTTKKIAGNQVHAEIKWQVLDATGTEAGAVTQINEVPAGTLDQYWGDIAVAVTDQAAGGIKEIILNQADPRRTTPASAAVKLAPNAGKPATAPGSAASGTKPVQPR
jgi:hypothetical protein